MAAAQPEKDWREEVRSLFARDGQPYLVPSLVPHLASLCEQLLERRPVTTENIQDAVVAAVALRATSTPDPHRRALMEAALAFLMIGPRHDDDLRLAVYGNPSRTRAPKAMSKLIRDSLAQVAYRRSLDPTFDQPQGERAGRKKRGPAVDELVQAIELAVNDLPAWRAQVDSLRRESPSDGASLRELCARLLWNLDVAPGYYPADMVPSELGTGLFAYPIDHEDTAILDDTILYRTPPTRAGVRFAVDALAGSRRAVLLGDPGSGKTTSLVAHLVRELGHHELSPVIFVRAVDLARVVTSRGIGSVDDLAYAVIEAAELSGRSTLTRSQRLELVEAIRELPGATVGIDGLDEVLDPLQRAALDVAFGHLESAPCRLIVTSRYAGYRRPIPLADEYVVDSLSPSTVEEFFDRWFKSRSDLEGHARARDALNGSDAIAAAARIPVIAGLVAYVAETDSVPAEVPALYDRYIKLLLERRWKPADQRREDSLEVAALIGAARDLAWSMATTRKMINPPLGVWKDIVTAEEVVELTAGANSGASELVRVDGLLTAHGLPPERSARADQQYRWLHRTLHEHLAGAHLAWAFARHEAGSEDLVLAAAQTPAGWGVPLQHAMGVLPDGDRERLARSLRLAETVGDPGQLIREARQSIAAHLVPDSPERQQLVQAADDEHDWSTLFRLAPDHARTSAQRDDMVADPNFSQLAFWLGQSAEPTDLPLLERLLEYPGVGIDDRRSLIQALSGIDPSRGAELALELLREAPAAAPPILDRDASEHVIQRIEAAAAIAPFPDARRLLELAQLAGSTGVSRLALRQSVALRLADLTLRHGDLTPAMRSTAREAIAGEHGAWAAYTVALERHELEVGPDADPWARAARNRLRPLIASEFDVDRSTGLAPGSLPHHDVEAVLAFQHWLARSTWGHADVRAAIELWASSSRNPSRESWAAQPWMDDALRDRILERLLSLEPIVLLSKLRDHLAVTQDSRAAAIVGRAIAVTGATEFDDLITEFPSHFIGPNGSGLWVVDRPHDPEMVVEALITRLDPARFAENAIWVIARWIADASRLPAWRSRLLQLGSAADRAPQT